MLPRCENYEEEDDGNDGNDGSANEEEGKEEHYGTKSKNGNRNDEQNRHHLNTQTTLLTSSSSSSSSNVQNNGNDEKTSDDDDNVDIDCKRISYSSSPSFQRISLSKTSSSSTLSPSSFQTDTSRGRTSSNVGVLAINSTAASSVSSSSSSSSFSPNYRMGVVRPESSSNDIVPPLASSGGVFGKTAADTNTTNPSNLSLAPAHCEQMQAAPAPPTPRESLFLRSILDAATTRTLFLSSSSSPVTEVSVAEGDGEREGGMRGGRFFKAGERTGDFVVGDGMRRLFEDRRGGGCEVNEDNKASFAEGRVVDGDTGPRCTDECEEDHAKEQQQQRRRRRWERGSNDDCDDVASSSPCSSTLPKTLLRGGLPVRQTLRGFPAEADRKRVVGCLAAVLAAERVTLDPFNSPHDYDDGDTEEEDDADDGELSSDDGGGQGDSRQRPLMWKHPAQDNDDDNDRGDGERMSMDRKISSSSFRFSSTSYSPGAQRQLGRGDNDENVTAQAASARALAPKKEGPIDDDIGSNQRTCAVTLDSFSSSFSSSLSSPEARRRRRRHKWSVELLQSAASLLFLDKSHARALEPILRIRPSSMTTAPSSQKSAGAPGAKGQDNLFSETASTATAATVGMAEKEDAVGIGRSVGVAGLTTGIPHEPLSPPPRPRTMTPFPVTTPPRTLVAPTLSFPAAAVSTTAATHHHHQHNRPRIGISSSGSFSGNIYPSIVASGGSGGGANEPLLSLSSLPSSALISTTPPLAAAAMDDGEALDVSSWRSPSRTEANSLHHHYRDTEPQRKEEEQQDEVEEHGRVHELELSPLRRNGMMHQKKNVTASTDDTSGSGNVRDGDGCTSTSLSKICNIPSGPATANPPHAMSDQFQQQQRQQHPALMHPSRLSPASASTTKSCSRPCSILTIYEQLMHPFVTQLSPGAGRKCLALLLLHHLLRSPTGYDARVRHAFKRLAIVILVHEHIVRFRGERQRRQQQQGCGEGNLVDGKEEQEQKEDEVAAKAATAKAAETTMGGTTEDILKCLNISSISKQAAREFEELERSIAQKLLSLSELQEENKRMQDEMGVGGVGARGAGGEIPRAKPTQQYGNRSDSTGTVPSTLSVSTVSSSSSSSCSGSSSSTLTRDKLLRTIKITSAGVVAGTLFAVTGGLAAPGIAAGIAAATAGTAAAASSATAAVVGVLSTPAAVTAVFGVGGGGLVGYKVQRRTKGLTEFEFRRWPPPSPSAPPQPSQAQTSSRGRKEHGELNGCAGAAATNEVGGGGASAPPGMERRRRVGVAGRGRATGRKGGEGGTAVELFTTVCLSGWLLDPADFDRPWGVPMRVRRRRRTQGQGKTTVAAAQKQEQGQRDAKGRLRHPIRSLATTRQDVTGRGGQGSGRGVAHSSNSSFINRVSLSMRSSSSYSSFRRGEVSDYNHHYNVRALEEFYKIYNPEQMKRAGTILQQWKGEEDQLWELLREKYGMDPSMMTMMMEEHEKKAHQKQQQQITFKTGRRQEQQGLQQGALMQPKRTLLPKERMQRIQAPKGQQEHVLKMIMPSQQARLQHLQQQQQHGSSQGTVRNENKDPNNSDCCHHRGCGEEWMTNGEQGQLRHDCRMDHHDRGDCAEPCLEQDDVDNDGNHEGWDNLNHLDDDDDEVLNALLEELGYTLPNEVLRQDRQSHIVSIKTDGNGEHIGGGREMLQARRRRVPPPTPKQRMSQVQVHTASSSGKGKSVLGSTTPCTIMEKQKEEKVRIGTNPPRAAAVGGGGVVDGGSGGGGTTPLSPPARTQYETLPGSDVHPPFASSSSLPASSNVETDGMISGIVIKTTGGKHSSSNRISDGNANGNANGNVNANAKEGEKEKKTAKLEHWNYHSKYGGELYTVRWESDLLMELCDSVTDLALDVVGGATTHILKQTALHTLLSAFAWPYALVNAANMIDGTWTLAIERADLAGVELAKSLLESGAGHRPVTLLGYSMGARMIYACLKELARHQEIWEAEAEEQRERERRRRACEKLKSSSRRRRWHGYRKLGGGEQQQQHWLPGVHGVVSNDAHCDYCSGSEEHYADNNDDNYQGNRKPSSSSSSYSREPASIVEDAILMGCPNHLSLDSWTACRRIVAGRLVNCYSRKDLMLLLMFQYKRVTGIRLRPVCGTCPVMIVGVENYDVSNLITNHSDYCNRIRQILDLVGYGQPMPDSVPLVLS